MGGRKEEKQEGRSEEWEGEKREIGKRKRGGEGREDERMQARLLA